MPTFRALYGQRGRATSHYARFLSYFDLLVGFPWKVVVCGIAQAVLRRSCKSFENMIAGARRGAVVFRNDGLSQDRSQTTCKTSRKKEAGISRPVTPVPLRRPHISRRSPCRGPVVLEGQEAHQTLLMQPGQTVESLLECAVNFLQPTQILDQMPRAQIRERVSVARTFAAVRRMGCALRAADATRPLVRERVPTPRSPFRCRDDLDRLVPTELTPGGQEVTHRLDRRRLLSHLVREVLHSAITTVSLTQLFLPAKVPGQPQVRRNTEASNRAKCSRSRSNSL